MARPFEFCPRCATSLVERVPEGDDRSRRVCPACAFVHYGNPVPVAAVIVEHEGDVILARNVAWPPRMFSLITGFVEAGELPEETAVRETAEELGLAARDPSFVGIYGFAPLNQLLIAYHVVAEGEVVLNAELAEYKRVPIAKLRPWPIGPGPAVGDWLARRAKAG